MLVDLFKSAVLCTGIFILLLTLPLAFWNGEDSENCSRKKHRTSFRRKRKDS